MSGKKELSREYKELMDIFDRKAITSVFQPVVDLKTGEVFGYEALSRGPVGSVLAAPDKLFSAAETYKCLWKLDYLCRRMAIERVQDKLKDKFLFINVDPKILYDKKFHQGSTLKLLQKWDIDRRNVVFEVSEKTAITDYDGFRAVLENYRMQGYKIALDDVGSGYSGLTLLANALPNFIKIDIALIREVDKDNVKRAIIKSLIDVARVTRSKIIAEGIEREEELLTLMKLGADYGQGFYLGKPSAVIVDIDSMVRQKIRMNYQSEKIPKYNSGNGFVFSRRRSRNVL